MNSLATDSFIRDLAPSELDVVSGGQGGDRLKDLADAKEATAIAAREACLAISACVAALYAAYCYKTGRCGTKKVVRINTDEQIAGCQCRTLAKGGIKGRAEYACYCAE